VVFLDKAIEHLGSDLFDVIITVGEKGSGGLVEELEGVYKSITLNFEHILLVLRLLEVVEVEFDNLLLLSEVILCQ